jgi:4-diphosphocytidyl-2-C-methyl-D-erythritol kinase
MGPLGDRRTVVIVNCSQPITVLAPAKLTRNLRVTGVRDDGLHLIEAEMVTLDLFDELTIEPGGAGLRLSEEGVPVELDSEDNLVRRAAALAGVEIGVSLHKRIPAGAGLGGGSADAAAILRWAGFTDVEAAASIGADVAFCLVGGRANVSGIGEIIEPLPFESLTFTVVTPSIHCSTPAVYRMWDELGGPVGDNGNDLEPAALALAPALARTRDQLGDATGLTPRLAGSGSSWFVEGDHPEVGLVLETVPAAEETR